MQIAIIEDILEMVAKFKQRPGAILLSPEGPDSILCIYAHEQLLIRFSIKGTIKTEGFYKITSLLSGDFEKCLKTDIDIKLFKGRYYKWEERWNSLSEVDKLKHYDDLIVGERFRDLINIAPVFNEGAELVLEGIEVLKNKAVVSNGVVMVSSDTEVKPKKPFNVPLHILSFISKNIPITIQTAGIDKDETEFNCVSGLDWQLLFLNVGGYPEVDTILPTPWNTEIDFSLLRDAIYANLKNIDGESYICNMHFTADSETYRVQLVAVEADDTVIDTIEVSIGGILQQPTSSTDCFLQVNLLQLEKLCRLNICPNVLRFNWAKQVILPICLGDSSTYNFALIMPMKPGKELQWISR